MTFSNGKQGLAVHWRETSSYRTFLDDRGHDSPQEPIQVLGQNGTMFNYSASDHTTILPPKGENFLEIRGSGSEKAYRDLIAKLRPVDVDTWLAALPASVVMPAETRATVDGMLVDVPVPAGFNREPLYKVAPLQERYHIGVRVVNAVTCAWLGYWTEAKKAGDTKRMKEAVTALKSNPSWPVLREMDAVGDWSMVIREYADSLGKGFIQQGWQRSLQC